MVLTTRTPVRRIAVLFATGLAVSLSSAALAQGRDKAPPPDEPALRGPAVQDRDVPGVRSRFGEGAEGRDGRAADRIPPRVFRDAIEDALGQDAPADVRATPEQHEKIRALVREHEESVRAYMREHRDELRDLRDREDRGPRGGGGPERDEMASPEGDAPPPPPPPPGGPRGRGRELMENAPPVADLYTKVWAELRPEQRAAVESRLDAFRERAAKAREEGYVDRRLGRRRDGPDGPPTEGQRRRRPGPPQAGDDRPPPPPGAGRPRGPERDDAFADRISPERHHRLLRLFAQLPPDAQDRLLDRMEQRMRDEAGARGRRPEGAPKLPPPIGDLDVPDPDRGEPPPPPPRPSRES